MPPSPVEPCGRCQRWWIRVSPRNLRPLFARSQTVLPSRHRARSPGNRSRAVSLHARRPSKDPRTAVHTRNQQVDEQALFSCKNRDSNLLMIFTGARAARELAALALGNRMTVDQCGGIFGATASAIDFSIRPRSLLVERTAVVSFSNAARITSRLRKNE